MKFFVQVGQFSTGDFDERWVKIKPALTLIHRWLTKPYVAKWFYGDGLANTLKGIDECIKGVSDAKYWLACDRDKPFAFLITSLVNKPKDELARWCVAKGTTIVFSI